MTKLILALALAICAPAFADETAAPATTEAPAAAPAAPAKSGKMHAKHKRGSKKGKKGAAMDAPKAE